MTEDERSNFMWKRDDNGNLIADETGNPILVKEDGTEAPFDLKENEKYISSIKSEAIERRHKLKEYEEKLALYEGLDPEKAREALTKVESLDEKSQLEIEKLSKRYEEQMSERVGEVEAKYKQAIAELHNTQINNAFATSRFIDEFVAVPKSMMQAEFGKHFKYTEHGVVGLSNPSDPNSIIYSADNPSRPADFNEAIAKLVNQYPDKDNILKASGNSGSGVNSKRNGGVIRKSLAECTTEEEIKAYLSQVK